MLLFPAFAVAGAALAVGCAMIHLINRRRHRTVAWGAMDFLNEAVHRSRRMLRVEDLLLLLLRVGCLLLLGLAMARPVWQRSADRAVAPDEPIHVVLLVDNSLSMAYRSVDRSRLDTATASAIEFLRQLPPGSRYSIIPLCDPSGRFRADAWVRLDDAIETLEAIEPVDQRASLTTALDFAARACRATPSPEAKQIVLLSDLQASFWPADTPRQLFDKLPCPLDIVRIGSDATENVWVEDFRLIDDVAQANTPTTLVATITYQGAEPIDGIQVPLAIDGEVVASRTVSLAPGQSREVLFDDHLFEASATDTSVRWVTAEISVRADHLSADNRRFLVVPVTSGLPILFVDQYGAAAEDPTTDRLGETFQMRRLLASESMGDGPMHARHVSVEALRNPTDARELLAGTPLVILAGVADPEGAVGVLREYVEQGGTLVLAAGGAFDSAAWTRTAWLEGDGILPAPLEATFLGRAPDQGRVEPFRIDVDTVFDVRYLRLPLATREQTESLYRLPLFFLAVNADVSPATLSRMVDRQSEVIGQRRSRLTEIDVRLKALDGGAELETEDEQARLRAARRSLVSSWYRGALDDPVFAPASDDLSQASFPDARDLALHQRPRVLARYTNGKPFLLERPIGAGRVLMLTTGVLRDWNTLATTNAVVLFDRLARQLLADALPVRNLTTSDRLILPVGPEGRARHYALTQSDGRIRPLPVGALGGERFGVTVDRLAQRQLAMIAIHADRGSLAGLDAPIAEVPLAINGPSDESNLTPIPIDELADRLPAESYRMSNDGQWRVAASVGHGSRVLWKWLMAGVLVALLIELVVLGRVA